MIGITGRWRIREREQKTGLVIMEREITNLWTNYGVTALASAIGNAYTSPLSLVIESNYATLQLDASTPGATSILTDIRIDQSIDTQIVLSPGLATQEIIGFTGVTGTEPYTYTLATPTVNAHPVGDPVCRQVNGQDTMANVVGEIQYDPVNFPNQRAQSPGGYSNGVGNWTIQFYLPGPSALNYLMLCGLSDSATIGTGNLHNHFIIGYNHTNPSNDVEIDGSITLSNL